LREDAARLRERAAKLDAQAAVLERVDGISRERANLAAFAQGGRLPAILGACAPLLSRRADEHEGAAEGGHVNARDP
jgi:hypothetical protein